MLTLPHQRIHCRHLTSFQNTLFHVRANCAKALIRGLDCTVIRQQTRVPLLPVQDTEPQSKDISVRESILDLLCARTESCSPLSLVKNKCFRWM